MMQDLCRVLESLYEALDHPWLYYVAQSVLAPGGETAIMRKILEVLGQMPPSKLLLDVGCGPSSRLFPVGLDPVGVDVSLTYVLEYTRKPARAVVASAEALPFSSQSFGGVWSIGLLHHLPDRVAGTAIGEMIRVCKPGGYVAVFDAVMPHRAWRRFPAYLIRRLDRGRFMRSESALREMLPQHLPWHSQRFAYALSGLEGLICWLQV